MSATQKSIRIQTDINNPQDQYLTVPFDRSIGLIEVLSLKLPMKEDFRRFDSETSVIAGRVSSKSVGLPNVKVHLFLPKDENINTDNLSDFNKTKIKTAELQYPFTTPDTKDSSGKRFNLLPKFSRNRFLNGFPFNIFGIGSTPRVPIGTRIEPEELMSNEDLNYLEKKYYKYSTVTNQSGDYMIYCQSGDYQIVIELDATDLGAYSTTPALMSNVLGYGKQLFEQDGTKVKRTNDLDSAPNIFRQVTTVTAKPLWSQNSELANNSETIGITRQDFNVPIELKPYTTIFGNTIGQPTSTFYGDQTLFRIFLGLKCLCLSINCKLNNGNNCGWDFDFCYTKLAFNIPLPNPIGDIYVDTGINIPTGFKFQTPAFIPWMFLRLFSISYCKINKYNLEKTVFLWLGDIGCFKVNDIVDLSGQNESTQLLEALDKTFQTYNVDEDISNMENIKSNISVFQVKNTVTDFNNVDFKNDIELLSGSEYVNYVDNGTFVLQILTNSKKKITAEDGTLIDVDDDSNDSRGIFTEWNGYITLSQPENIIGTDGKAKIIRPNIRIPNLDNNFNSIYNFKFNTLYSVETLMGINNTENQCVGGIFPGGFFGQDVAFITGLFNDCAQISEDAVMYCTPGKILITNPDQSIYPPVNNYFNITVNNQTETVPNFSFDYLKYLVYVPNILARKPYISNKKTKIRCCSRVVEWDKLQPNENVIGGFIKNTQYYVNADYFKINFFEVDKSLYVDNVIEQNKGIKKGNQYYYKGFLGKNSLKNLMDKNLI
jgi:hypothetical protein